MKSFISRIMKKLIYLIPVLILAMGCNGIYENGEELAMDLKLSVNQISVEDLKAKLENDEAAFHLVDVRTKAEFEEGFINDSYDYNMYLMPVILPRGIIEYKISDADYWEDFFEDVPDKESSEIIIYSQNGDRGLLAANTLLQLGYKNVSNLDGGYDKWQSEISKAEITEK